MDSKTYTRELRKACVEAVFDEFAEHGDMIRPQYASLSLRRAWIEIAYCVMCGCISRNVALLTESVD